MKQTTDSKSINRYDIVMKLTDILKGVLDDNELTLTEDTTPNEVGEWDSANHIRFILAIEAEFDIRFEAAEIGSFEKVGQLVDCVQRKLTR